MVWNFYYNSTTEHRKEHPWWWAFPPGCRLEQPKVFPTATPSSSKPCWFSSSTSTAPRKSCCFPVYLGKVQKRNLLQSLDDGGPWWTKRVVKFPDSCELDCGIHKNCCFFSGSINPPSSTDSSPSAPQLPSAPMCCTSSNHGLTPYFPLVSFDTASKIGYPPVRGRSVAAVTCKILALLP